MSEQKAQTNQGNNGNQKGRKNRPEQRQPRAKRVFDIAELSEFLQTLNVGITPTIHVNGVAHPTAVITIDFGAPLQPVRLTQEQVQDLMGRLRKSTRDLLETDINVRVSSDHQNGIFWSSVA